MVILTMNNGDDLLRFIEDNHLQSSPPPKSSSSLSSLYYDIFLRRWVLLGPKQSVPVYDQYQPDQNQAIEDIPHANRHLAKVYPLTEELRYKLLSTNAVHAKIKQNFASSLVTLGMIALIVLGTISLAASLVPSLLSLIYYFLPTIATLSIGPLYTLLAVFQFHRKTGIWPNKTELSQLLQAGAGLSMRAGAVMLGLSAGMFLVPLLLPKLAAGLTLTNIILSTALVAGIDAVFLTGVNLFGLVSAPPSEKKRFLKQTLAAIPALATVASLWWLAECLIPFAAPVIVASAPIIPLFVAKLLITITFATTATLLFAGIYKLCKWGLEKTILKQKPRQVSIPRVSDPRLLELQREKNALAMYYYHLGASHQQNRDKAYNPEQASSPENISPSSAKSSSSTGTYRYLSRDFLGAGYKQRRHRYPMSCHFNGQEDVATTGKNPWQHLPFREVEPEAVLDKTAQLAAKKWAKSLRRHPSRADLSRYQADYHHDLREFSYPFGM